MSATKFFPIQRKAGTASSLYASDAGPAPADGRYFPIKPAAGLMASLYATPTERPPPADPAPAPAPAATDTTATAQYYPVDGDRPLPGAAATARDAYLRAMDVNARVLGLASHR